MHERTALWIWKTVAIGALGACATLLWKAPSRATTADTTDAASDVDAAPEASSHSDEHHRGVGSDMMKVSRSIDLARSPQARCMALSRLARHRDVDDTAVHHIASYTESDHMIEVRICATTALGETQHEDAIEPLIGLIDDSVNPVADAALMGLLQFEDTTAREAVLEAARSSREIIRLAALRALAIEGDPHAFSLITEALKNAHPNLQDQLMQILGSTRDPRAVGLLYDFVKTGSRRQQFTALNALAELGGARAESVLIQTLRENPGLSVAACQSLSRLDSEDATEALLEAAEGDYGAQVSAAALQALTQRQSPAITALMTDALEGNNMQQMHAAVEYFASHGIASAVPKLTELVGRGGQQTWHYVAALGRIGGDQARASIEQLAEQPGIAGQAALQVLSSMPNGMVTVRRLAITQLQQGAGNRGPELVALLSNDDSPEARAAVLGAARSADPNLSAQAINYLGQRKDPESIQLLEDMFTEAKTPMQRSSALGALVQSGDPSGQQHLRNALKDPSPDVRAHAVQLMAESGGRDLESAMLEASRDNEPTVAGNTTYALSQLGTPNALSRLEEMARAAAPSSPQALHALASTAPDRAGPIAEALASSSDSQSRLAAVQISSMLPPEASKRIMVNAMRSEDSMVVREALGYIGGLGLPTQELQGLLRPLRQNKELPEDIGQMAAQLLGES